MALVLTGCSTTQETAMRLQLNSYREIAAQNATIVTRPSASVQVTGVSLVRGTGARNSITVAAGDAYVVTIHNTANHAVSDLPVSVGYVRRGTTHRVDVNGSDTLSYFQAHLGLIAAHTTVIWIYTALPPAAPAGATPFALVGAEAPASISAAPTASAAVWKFNLSLGAPDAGRSVELKATNHTGIPQYGLPLYVYVLRSGRAVSAGAATVSTLNPGDSASVRVALVGNFDGGQLHAEVLPADAR